MQDDAAPAAEDELVERLRETHCDTCDRRKFENDAIPCSCAHEPAAAHIERQAREIANLRDGVLTFGQSCAEAQSERDAAQQRADALHKEMQRRDEQWLEMIALCDEHMMQIKTPIEDNASVDAWMTVSKNLGMARVVIESRIASPTEAT